MSSTDHDNAADPEHNRLGIVRNSKGWDGKLRVEKKAIITNPEALSDPEYSDEEAPPVEQIDPDEGRPPHEVCVCTQSTSKEPVADRSATV